jgi:hypothetical protein
LQVKKATVQMAQQGIHLFLGASGQYGLLEQAAQTGKLSPETPQFHTFLLVFKAFDGLAPANHPKVRRKR